MSEKQGENCSKEDAEQPEDDLVDSFVMVTTKSELENMSFSKEEAEHPDKETVFSEMSSCNLMQLDYWKKMVENKNFTVMVSGKPRTGKSTALNNLLGLKLPASASVHSVTKKVVVESSTSQHGVRARGIDTPGLRAHDMDTNNVLKDMEKEVESDVSNFTLLYCISVMNTIEIRDEVEIMKNLTKQLGADIWKRCTLVLTFCDTARSQNFKSRDQDDEYNEYLTAYAEAFRDALGQVIPEAPAVKVILDCEVEPPDNDKMTKVKVPSDTIVAIPAARTKEEGRDPNILPGFNIGGNILWTEYALFEVMRSSGRLKSQEIEEFKMRYNLSTLASSSEIMYRAVGAVIGGAIAGPIGAAVGDQVGKAVWWTVSSLKSYTW